MTDEKEIRWGFNDTLQTSGGIVAQFCTESNLNERENFWRLFCWNFGEKSCRKLLLTTRVLITFTSSIFSFDSIF